MITNGTGGALISAGRTIQVNADLVTETGDISLIAVENIVQNANVTTQGGTIDLQAGAAILMTDGTRTAANNADISIVAGGDVTIAAVNAGTGSVVIVSANGSILDGGDIDTDVVAAAVILTAASNIGTTTNALEITVERLTAVSATGDIIITETDDLVIDAVTVEINRVNGIGQATTAIVATQADVQTTGTGSIVIRTLDGSITLNDGDSDGVAVVSEIGTVLLQTAGVDANLILNASVTSTGSALSLIAGGAIHVGASVEIVNSSTIDVEASNGSVMMSDTASISSNGGNIRVMALADITLGGINAQTGSITIVSVTGRVLDGGDTHLDIKSSSLKLRAGGDIGGAGANTNPIDIDVDTITAFSDTGDIYLNDQSDLTIDSVTVTVQRVDEAGGVSDIVGVEQGDVQTNGISNISIVTTGDLTLATGADVSSAGASVELESTSGSIVMADQSTISSATGSIRIAAAGDVLVGGIEALAGNVSIISVTGNILDAGDSYQDVRTLGLRLTAAGDIGEIGINVDPLEITAATVSAVTAGGNINLLSSGNITVDAVAVTVRRTDDAGVFAFVEDAAQSDLQTSGTGTIIFATVDGDITINDGSDIEEAMTSAGATSLAGDIGDGRGIVTEAGNVLLFAGGSGNSILVNTDIVTTGGAVSVIAGNSVTFTADADIRTLNSSIDIEATTGAITLDDESLITSQGGNVRLSAVSNIVLGGISTGSGSVSLLSSAGSVFDGGDIYVDIAALNLMIIAGSDIGMIAGVTNPLEISVGSLTANSGGGDINLVESDNLTIEMLANVISRVLINGDTSLVTDATRSDVQTTGDGSIMLVTGGDLTVTSSDADAAGILTEMGDITVVGAGATLTAAIGSNAGNVTIDVQNGLTLEARGNITTGGQGVIALTADAGNIEMKQDSSIQSGTGGIALSAGGDLLLTSVVSMTGDVQLITTGSVLDTSVREFPNVQTTGSLIIEAQSGVGLVSEDLDTAVSSLTVTNSTAGDIVIDQVGSLLVNGTGIANGGNGNISINLTTGTLTIAAPVRTSGNIGLNAQKIIILNSVSNEIGDISVTATETDVVLEGNTATVKSEGGHITITAVNDVLLTVVNSGGSGISINATNGSIVDNLPGEDSNLVTPGLLQISAGKDIGQSGDGNINIDAGTLNIGFFNGENISVEFVDGREFSGSAENLYFITTKRDFEPHITSRLTPDSLRQVYETARTNPLYRESIGELLEDVRSRELLGEYSLGMREPGSLLRQNGQDLRLSLSLLASSQSSLAEDYNEALAAKLQQHLHEIAIQ